MEIQCNLYQMKISDDRIVPPDVEINVKGKLHYLFNVLENGFIAQGIQYDGKNVEEVEKQCKTISREILKLYKLIGEEKNE